MPGMLSAEPAALGSCAAARSTVRRVSPKRTSLSMFGREHALVVRRERPGRRVLRPQRAGGHAAPLRQRRHRQERPRKCDSRANSWSRSDAER